MGEGVKLDGEMDRLSGLVREEELPELVPGDEGGVRLAADDLVGTVGDGGVEQQEEGEICVAPPVYNVL